MNKKKVISFGFLIVAFIFFANPNISIIDFLPDCIACLMIAFAISKVSDLCDDLSDAKKAFYTLFWITVSKGPALVLLLFIVGKNMNEATMWLLFSFCYAVAETVFGIRAFNAFFGGLAYLGSRNDGGEFIFIPNAAEVSESGGNRKFNILKIFTAVFIVVKSAMFTIPDLVYVYPQDDINPTSLNILRFRPLFIFLGAAVVFAVGAVWLVAVCKYVLHLAKHKSFWADMQAKYEEKVLPKTGLFVMRNVHIFAIVIIVALCFSADFYIDEYNVLPDFISALLFFVGAWVIGKYSGGAKALKITSALYFATAVFTFVAMLMFKTDCFSAFGYTYRNVYSNANAARLYMIYAVSNAVTQVAFLSVVFSLASTAMRIVRMHTGMNSITDVSSSFRTLDKVYASRFNRMRVLSVLVSVASVLYFYLMVYFERTETQLGYSYMPKYWWIRIVDFAVGLIFVVHASNVLNDLLGEVEYKYKFD